jgi:hypothetical protein
VSPRLSVHDWPSQWFILRLDHQHRISLRDRCFQTRTQPSDSRRRNLVPGRKEKVQKGPQHAIGPTQHAVAAVRCTKAMTCSLPNKPHATSSQRGHSLWLYLDYIVLRNLGGLPSDRILPCILVVGLCRAGTIPNHSQSIFSIQLASL